MKGDDFIRNHMASPHHQSSLTSSFSNLIDGKWLGSDVFFFLLSLASVSLYYQRGWESDKRERHMSIAVKDMEQRGLAP